MALEIFKLVGSIFVDSEEANKSLAKTDQKASGIGTTLMNGARTAAKWGSALVAGTIAAVAGITAFASKTAGACDEIDKMSQKLGISREAYQELDFIMSQNGMDINSLQTGMKSLTNQIYAAGEGSKTSAGYFEQLGVSVTDANGQLRSSEDVFYDSIAALQAMDNETQRNALANKLFGKSATELAPLLNSGAGSMEELRQKAHELGIVLDDSVIDSGVALTDIMDQLKRAGGSILVKLGGVLMPMVQNVADYIIGAMPQIGALISQLAPVISQIFSELIPPLTDLASQIFPMLLNLFSTLQPIITQIISMILPVIVQLLQTLLPPIIQIVSTLLPPLLGLLEPILGLLGPLIELLNPILTVVVAILQPLANLITNLITPLVGTVTKLIKVALVPLQAVFTTLSGVLSGTFSAAVDYVMNIVETMKGVFSGIIDFVSGVFTGDWSAAWEGVEEIFSSIWEGIKEAFKMPINWIIDGINAFIRGLNKLTIPDWVPIVGGKGFHIDEIPKLYNGGVLEKGQTGFIEGTGAEAVVPLENNRKWIRAVANDMNSEIGVGSSKSLEGKIDVLIEAVKEIAQMELRLSTGELVGVLSDKIDNTLGQKVVIKKRTAIA